ncbi:MAG: hypothetical protein R3C59_09930 [Planctomycetaceae bacterium]
MAAIQSAYKIALFGPTNAGKTVYLTTLCVTAATRRIRFRAHVAASDDKDDVTHDYLTKAFQKLRAGQWPDGTVFEKLNNIELTITAGGVQSKVQLPDVAGEVTGRGQKIENWTEFEHELKKEILDEFSTYDGFLIFAPADDTVKGDSVSFKWEVDSLLFALKERASADGLIRRPVAVVLSKWDVVASTRTGKTDEQADAEEHFRYKYPETANALTESCENWRVFPVSATGSTTNGRPPEILRPTGVAAPIVWLLRTADRTSLERADEYVKKNMQHLFAKPDASGNETYAQRAMQRYKRILAKSPGAETINKSRAGIANLRKISRTRTIKRLAALTAVVLAVWTWVDYRSYASASSELSDAKQVAEELDPTIERARAYVDSHLHPIGALCGWKTELKGLVDQREAKWESAWASKLKTFVFEDATRAEELVSDCDAFRKRFKDSNQGLEIERISDDAKRFADQQRGDMAATQLMERDKDLLEIGSNDIDQLEQWVSETETFLDAEGFAKADRRSDVQTALANRRALLAKLSSEKDWASLKSRYAELGETPLEQYLTIRQWLAEAGQPQTIHADEANRMMAKSLSAADSKAWRDLQEYETKNSTNYQRHIEKSNEYLARVEFSEHREEVKEFRQKVLTQWDEQLYRFITDEIKDRELTGDQLAKIQSRCKTYLDSQTRPVAMRSEVEAWLSWYRQMETGVTTEVELKSVKVDRGSRWHGLLYYPSVSVSVKVNGRSDTTEEKNIGLGVQTSGFGQSKLGPFEWKLGDQDLVVLITCTDYSDETLTCSFPQDTFKLRHLNETVSFDDGLITARLECAAASPPALPPFEAAR